MLNWNPQVKSLVQTAPQGKPKYNKKIFNTSRYNCPVYLPKHIYSMLSEEVKKELEKYNQEKRSTTNLLIPGWRQSMSAIMMMIAVLKTVKLILTITILMTHTPCRNQVLRNSHKHMSLLSQNGIILPYLHAFCFFLWVSSRQGSQW